MKRKLLSTLALVAVVSAIAGCTKRGEGEPKAVVKMPVARPTKDPVDAAQALASDCADQDCRALSEVAKISTVELFEMFASNDHQLGVHGKSVKFLIDARKPEAPVVHFMNGNFTVNGAVPQSALMHYNFAREYLQIPEAPMAYNLVTYFTDDKRYVAGAIQRYRLDATKEDIYGLQFFPQDVASEAAILRVAKTVMPFFKLPNVNMAFVATGVQQTTATVAADLSALGLRVLSMNDVLGATDYLPLNPGVAYGYLQVFPTSQDTLRATDIVVFDELPLDLTVVAGVVTRAYQDPNSHVNLKSRERDTPNMMLRRAAPDTAEWLGLAGKPVKLTVRMDGFRIEPATEAEVERRLAERMAKPWVPMGYDDTEVVASVDELCDEDAADCLAARTKYGSKAANIGFLAQRDVLGRAANAGTMSARLGYDLSPRGVAVPVGFYPKMLADPANAALKAKVDVLVLAEKAGTLSTSERRAQAAEVQALFLRAKLPEALSSPVKAKIKATFGEVASVKVRSSANAEDITGFNGAGLYDSFKVRPGLSEDSSECFIQTKLNKVGALKKKLVPDTVECAMKAAYASLWNLRAIEERSFARVDHATAAMGLAIVPAYDLESKIDANAVLITRVLNTDTLSGYSISTNDKNNLVTNPAPGSWSEQGIAVLLTAEVPTSITVTRFAKPRADKPEMTRQVMTREQTLAMVEIARAVELAYCRTNADYYPKAVTHGCEWSLWDEDKPRALDFEFKLLKNGQFVSKQVREFSGHK